MMKNAYASGGTCGAAGKKIRWIVIAIFAILTSCRSKEPVTPVLDCGEAGSDASASEDEESMDANSWDDCTKACVNLRKPAVHCPSGFSVDGGETCAKSCRHAHDSHLMPIDIACAQKARTPQEAHACKGWGCP